MHKTSPKYRGRAENARPSHHRAGKRERAEQARHRVLNFPAPTGTVTYTCTVPDCTTPHVKIPINQRDSWRVKVGHFGPMPNKKFDKARGVVSKADARAMGTTHNLPIYWIPYLRTMDACPDCWMRMVKSMEGFITGPCRPDCNHKY